MVPVQVLVLGDHLRTVISTSFKPSDSASHIPPLNSGPISSPQKRGRFTNAREPVYKLAFFLEFGPSLWEKRNRQIHDESEAHMGFTNRFAGEA